MLKKYLVAFLLVGTGVGTAQEAMNLPPYKPDPEVIKNVMLPPSRWKLRTP